MAMSLDASLKNTLWTLHFLTGEMSKNPTFAQCRLIKTPRQWRDTSVVKKWYLTLSRSNLTMMMGSLSRSHSHQAKTTTLKQVDVFKAQPRTSLRIATSLIYKLKLQGTTRKELVKVSNLIEMRVKHQLKMNTRLYLLVVSSWLTICTIRKVNLMYMIMSVLVVSSLLG